MFADPASVLMGLRMMRRGGGPVYLLRDEFTTDASAPLTSPRTCEPGPGTVVITDPSNAVSIAGGQLLMGTKSADTFDTGLWSSSSYARSSGLVMAFTYNQTTATDMHNGFDTDQSSDTRGPTIRIVSTRQVQAWDTDSIYPTIGTVSDGVNYTFAIVLRAAGAFYIKDSTLLYVRSTLTNTPLYAGLSKFTKTSIAKYGFFRVAQMVSPWNDDYGIATNRVASASAGETTTSEANALVEATWTAATGETWELDVRRTDADNRWVVRCDQAGGTIKLIERNAGSETERNSASQTWTNGSSYRLVVVQDTQTIKTYVANIAKNSYTSASFNQTATGVKTSHAVANLIAWPRTLSGAALAELQRYTA